MPAIVTIVGLVGRSVQLILIHCTGYFCGNADSTSHSAVWYLAGLQLDSALSDQRGSNVGSKMPLLRSRRLSHVTDRVRIAWTRCLHD